MGNTIYDYICVGAMNADTTYQREPDLIRIRKYSKEWEDRLASIILVSKREDGSYWVMDGNHTRLAAKERFGPDHKLLCSVYIGLTLSEEAEIFTKRNSAQKKPTFNEMLRAKLTARDPFTIQYFHCLDAAGLSYGFGSGTSGKTFQAHASLTRILKSNYATDDLFTRAIRAGADVSTCRDDFLRSGIFPGFCLAIIKNPNIDDVRLIKVAKRTPLEKIINIANTYKRGSVSGGGAAMEIYYQRAFIDLYNSGLRKNKIPN